MKSSFVAALQAPLDQRGFALSDEEVARTVTVSDNGHSSEIGHGAVVIAAITSCTNTSNPSVMLGAGLLAKKAVEHGLTLSLMSRQAWPLAPALSATIWMRPD
jgi:aconitate hydratase